MGGTRLRSFALESADIRFCFRAKHFPFVSHTKDPLRKGPYFDEFAGRPRNTRPEKGQVPSGQKSVKCGQCKCTLRWHDPTGERPCLMNRQDTPCLLKSCHASMLSFLITMETLKRANMNTQAYASATGPIYSSTLIGNCSDVKRRSVHWYFSSTAAKWLRSVLDIRQLPRSFCFLLEFETNLKVEIHGSLPRCPCGRHRKCLRKKCPTRLKFKSIAIKIHLQLTRPQFAGKR